MFSFLKRAQDKATEGADADADLATHVQAVNRSMAVADFSPDGIILGANDNFLQLMDYQNRDIVGKPHRIFCEPAFVESGEYQKFWDRLREGEFVRGRFKRQNSSGRTVWLQASYSPVIDANGKICKIVKLAEDITKEVESELYDTAKISAINRAMAVIEFEPDGIIRSANDNFLKATGYSMAEIKGRHHRIFCAPDYAGTDEYKHFWQSLSSGSYVTGRFKRIRKNGDEFWLEASYNPVFDSSGKVMCVIKLALDITPKIKQYFLEMNKAKEVGVISTGTQKISGEGGKIIHSAVAEVNRITESIQKTADIIAALDHQSEQIGSIVQAIRDIADQTNLLALNAAIEAARAGEAGRGFSVVADEVRKLSVRTSHSTVEIAEMVRNIQNGAKAAISGMESCRNQAEKGAELANAAGDIIVRINDGASQVVTAIAELTDSLTKQET